MLAKLLRRLVRFVRPGGGSALPGLVLSKVAPNLLRNVLLTFPRGIAVVSGSAGKSTTTKMMVAIARAHGLVVFTNPSTANILQGFYSAILEKCDWRGRVVADVAILEMDEGHAASLLREVKPRQVTILNVTDDQLDRFVDPELVRDKLQSVAAAATEAVILASDDQNCLLIAAKQEEAKRVSWFGAPYASSAEIRGLGFANTFSERLDTPAPNTSVLSLVGQSAQFNVAGRETTVSLPNRGLHYALDAAAALESSRRLLANFSPDKAAEVLSGLPPVFARGEVAEVRGQKIEFILVQNPASFQLNLDNLVVHPECLMIAIGRDVHDPSWLWTVDFSKIRSVQMITGYNAAEMALRLGYEAIFADQTTDDLELGIENFLALPGPATGMKTIIFSADAMRRTRRYLGLTNPEEVAR